MDDGRERMLEWVQLRDEPCRMPGPVCHDCLGIRLVVTGSGAATCPHCGRGGSPVTGQSGQVCRRTAAVVLHGPAGLLGCCLSHAAAALRSEPASLVVWANHANLLRLLAASDRPIRIALRPDRGRPPVPDPAGGPQEDGAATRPGPGLRYDGATSEGGHDAFVSPAVHG